MTHRILVAGIGNIFLGDDAFGVEVAARLSARHRLPENVRLIDFGIRGFDLAYALLEDFEAVVLVDAIPRAEPAGTLYTMELDMDAVREPAEGGLAVETHGMNPMHVLSMVKALDGHPRRVLLVGCEPSPETGEDEERMGLSDPVQAAVEEAATMVEALVARLLGETQSVSAGS